MAGQGLTQAPLQDVRPDLKLIVMSATLDAAKFSAFFQGAKAAYVQVSCHCFLHAAAPTGQHMQASLFRSKQSTDK